MSNGPSFGISIGPKAPPLAPVELSPIRTAPNFAPKYSAPIRQRQVNVPVMLPTAEDCAFNVAVRPHLPSAVSEIPVATATAPRVPAVMEAKPPVPAVRRAKPAPVPGAATVPMLAARPV